MYETVLNFWFSELTPEMWWQKDEILDSRIRERFALLHKQARNGELYSWRGSPEGGLAEIIVLDQFSRNIYRGTPQAFENDSLALALAQFAVEKGFNKALNKTQCSFLYLPYMHSESAVIHKIAEVLYTELGLPENLAIELQHKAIIDRFGRYPHRNKILGRESSIEELEFLTQPGSSF